MLPVCAVSVCRFDVRSDDQSLSGTITSPNYPGLYPRNVDCQYVFHGLADQRVAINFTHFDVEGIAPASVHVFDVFQINRTVVRTDNKIRYFTRIFPQR